MEDKKISINNFIGVYDGFITPQECDRVIKFYEKQHKLNQTFDRLISEKTSPNVKKDMQYFADRENLSVWWEDFKSLVVNFELTWQNYKKATGADSAYDYHPFFFTSLKVQKTVPTGGYHVWHIEHNKGYENEARAFAWSIYLNDVEEGGETEFLNFSQRIKPKKGRIVIWPAAFPYLHRGNPPLSGEKYIMTSWMMLR